LQSVRLTRVQEKKAPAIEDRSYPFEFSLPWPEDATEMRLVLSATSVAGKEEEPLALTLRRN